MRVILYNRNSKRGEAPRSSLGCCLLVLFTALACTTGCGQKGQEAADLNPVGAYTLTSIDGKQVPCTVSHEGHSLTIKSGTFVINADGTCSSSIAFTIPSGGESSREVKATYTREGSKLTMRWEGAGMTTGTAQANTFTMTNEGMVLAYRK